MKRKWYKGQYGIEALTPASEVLPRKYKVKNYDLRKFGVPMVPVIGQTSYRRVMDEPARWHVHEGCIEFVYCAAGACEYESRGGRYQLKSGMMFVSQADEEHRQINCPKGYANHYLLFRPAANSMARWFASELAKLPRLFICGRSIPLHFGRIFSLTEGSRPGLDLRIRLQTEVQALLLDIIDSSTRLVKKADPSTLDAIEAKIRQHPERDYPLEKLVAESGMSKASFMSSFRTAYGYSPHSYLLYCRVESAKVLLRKGLAEKEVADRLGFATSQNLARAFSNYVGVSPRRWLALGKA